MLAEVTARMMIRAAIAAAGGKTPPKGYLKRKVCKNSRRQVDITILDRGWHC